MNDVFITRDLGVAATLLALGYKLLRPEQKENIVYFCFEKRELCEDIAKKFELRNEKIPVDAASYFEAVQRLKRQIFRLTERTYVVPQKHTYK